MLNKNTTFAPLRISGFAKAKDEWLDFVQMRSFAVNYLALYLFLCVATVDSVINCRCLYDKFIK